MVQIKKDIRSNINDIIELCNINLGKDYLTLHFLSSIQFDSNHTLNIAIENEKVIGFSIAQIISNSDSNELLLNHISISNKLFGLLKTVVVDSNYRNQGIGLKMSKESLSFFYERNISDIFSLSWENDSTANSKKMLQNMGFEFVKIIDNYWKNDSINKKYSCALCGDPPCLCSAMLYKHRLT